MSIESFAVVVTILLTAEQTCFAIENNLSLSCDAGILKWMVVNVNYGQFNVYEDGAEWTVTLNSTNDAIENKNSSLPEPIQRLATNISDIPMVAHNWINNTWIALWHGDQWYLYDKSITLWPLNAKVTVNALFFNPIDQQYYAIAGNQTFIVNDQMISDDLQPLKENLSQVKLVLFVSLNTMYLVEQFRYCKCDVEVRPKLDLKCSPWYTGDILCGQQPTVDKTFFWIIFGSLVVSVGILLILMFFCFKNSETTNPDNGKSKLNVNTSSNLLTSKASSKKSENPVNTQPANAMSGSDEKLRIDDK